MVATRTSRKKKEGLTEEEVAVLEVEEYEKRMKDSIESPKKKKRNPSSPSSSSSTSSPSSSSSVSSDGAFHLPALDGIRVLCTVWLIVFHTAYFSVTFLTKEQWKPWFYEYNGFIFNGLQGVDVFFVLTGLLLSYPLFYRHSSSQPISISWRSFVWRRLVRILPSYCVAIGFFCFVLTQNGEQHKLAAIPSTGIQMMLDEHYPGIDHVPSNCFLSGFNLLFLNNWLPFGGCMGWTWSLAIQVQFYVLFPLLVLLFKTPKRLALLMLVLWVATHLFRHWLMEAIMARYNFVMFLWDNADRESFYMYFTAWYANSFARMHCIFSGVLLAYALVHPLPFHFKPTTFFNENSLVRRCCSLLSLFVLHQTFFSSDLKGSTRPNMLYTVSFFSLSSSSSFSVFVLLLLL